MQQDAGGEEVKETVKTSYFVSLESNEGHAGADLRVLKVWYKGDTAVRWESTEERWDFHPNVPGNWQGGEDLPGGVTDTGEKKQSGTGAPPDDLPPEPKPPEGYAWGFYPIDEKGYEAAKKWVEPQVTTVGKGKDEKTLPGKPHAYNINSYNCGRFAADFVKKAGGPTLPPDVDGGQGVEPGNIKKWIKRPKCKHVWKVQTTEKTVGNQVWQTKLLVCEICGLTKPYY